MLNAEKDFFRTSLDATQQVAILDWHREVNLEEFKEGCNAFVQLVQTYKIDRCLINSTNRGFLAPEAESWLKDSLENKVSYMAAEEKQIAVVMSEEKYKDMVHDYSLLRVGHKSLPIDINYFTNIEEALHWLTNEEPSL